MTTVPPDASGNQPSCDGCGRPFDTSELRRTRSGVLCVACRSHPNPLVRILTTRPIPFPKEAAAVLRALNDPRSDLSRIHRANLALAHLFRPVVEAGVPLEDPDGAAKLTTSSTPDAVDARRQRTQQGREDFPAFEQDLREFEDEWIRRGQKDDPYLSDFGGFLQVQGRTMSRTTVYRYLKRRGTTWRARRKLIETSEPKATLDADRRTHS